MAEAQIVPGSIEAHALARHVRMSPQKARLVMDLIRGQKAPQALQTLQYTQKRAAKHIEKVLRSAIANARQKADEAGAPLDEDELYVSNWLVVKQGGVEEPCTAEQLVAIFGSITVARNVPLNPPPELICALILLSSTLLKPPSTETVMPGYFCMNSLAQRS